MKRPPSHAVKRVSTTRLYDGFFKLDQHVLDVPKHDGGTMRVKRLVLERGHSVAILAYDPRRDEVLLINQISMGAYAANETPFGNDLPAGSLWQG